MSTWKSKLHRRHGAEKYALPEKLCNFFFLENQGDTSVYRSQAMATRACLAADWR